MAEQCPEPRQDCQFEGTKWCIITQHHQYFPAKNYPTTLDKTFRNLQENLEPVPNCEHVALHAEQIPPDKPTRQFMLDALTKALMNNEIFLSKNKRRKIFGRQDG